MLEKAGHTDAAVTQLEALYRDRPEDGAIANALGFILADHSRDLARAERLISAALKSEPDNPAILDSMGWLDYRRGIAREALPLLERAFRLDQDGDIGAHWGEVLWSLGEKAKAREAWSRALIADPDNAPVKAAEQRAGVPQLSTRAPALRSEPAQMQSVHRGGAHRRGVASGWLIALLCAGCATTRPPPAPTAQPWEQRLPALQAITSFELDGRVAASDGRQGFSAGLRWRQQAGDASIDLSGPLGFGAAHIEQRPDGLRVTTAQGTTLTDAAASAQLAATLGFEPPLGSLRYWVLGASDPAVSSAGIDR